MDKGLERPLNQGFLKVLKDGQFLKNSLDLLWTTSFWVQKGPGGSKIGSKIFAICQEPCLFMNKLLLDLFLIFLKEMEASLFLGLGEERDKEEIVQGDHGVA